MTCTRMVIVLAAMLGAGCTGETNVTREEPLPVAQAGRWQITPIPGTRGGRVGKCGLAVDASSGVHVAYGEGSSLRYAFLKGTQCTGELVESGSALVCHRTGFAPDLALDTDGRPVITYGCRGVVGGTWVRRAHRTGDGKWDLATISQKGNLGLYTAAAVDGAGRLHAAYLDYKKRDDLYYAVARGDDWDITAVDVEPNAGFYCDLALDARSHPHIVYATVEGNYEGVDFTSNKYVVDDLKYATFDGNRWHTDTIDTYGNVGYWPSIRVDAKGIPHVSYAGEHQVKYAVHLDGAWTLQVVDQGDDVGTFTSLALDSGGRPWIAYDRGRKLHLAHWTGSEWAREVVDDSASVGAHCALEIDRAGTVHIVYDDRHLGGLKYARLAR